MANYTDIGISAADLEILKQPRKDYAWRLKVLKAGGQALPPANPDENWVGYDGTGHYPDSPDIDYGNAGVTGEQYKDIVVDDYGKRKRLFVRIEGLALDSDYYPFLMVDFKPQDGGAPVVYGFNKVTCDGWDATYTLNEPTAWGFDPENNRLLIGAYKTTGSVTSLFIIDCEQYKEEAATCSTLEDNPDFRACVVWTVTKPHSQLLKIAVKVVFHKGRYYCWLEPHGTTQAVGNGLGYFDMDGVWQFLFGSEYDSISYHIDKATNYQGFLDMKVVEEDDGDYMVASFNPNDGCPDTHYSYGWETMIAKVGLDGMIDHDADRTTGTQEEYSLEIEGVWVPGLGYHFTVGQQAGTGELDLSDWTEGWACVYLAANNPGGDKVGVEIRSDYNRVNFTAATMSTSMFVPPENPHLAVTMTVNTEFYDIDDSKITLAISLRKNPVTLAETLGVHSTTPIVGAADPVRPTADGNGDAIDYADTNYVRAMEADLQDGFYFMRIQTQGTTYSSLVGLWHIKNDGTQLKRYAVSDGFWNVGVTKMLALTGGGLFAVMADALYSATAEIRAQYFDTENKTVGTDYFQLLSLTNPHEAVSACYSAKHNELWIATEYEIRKFLPAAGDFSRWVHDWWDGENADFVFDGTNETDEEFGQTDRWFAPQFSQTKGQGSYSLSFRVAGDEYLPWAESKFNENITMPGSYSGTLGHGSRVVLERGILQANQSWKWVPEGQLFVVRSPSVAEAGFADMQVDCEGPIGMVLTRTVYKGRHEPDTQTYTDVTMISPDDLIYHYETGGETVTDWKLKPDPILKVDGAAATGYTLDTANGTVVFGYSMAGKVVTATFDAYVSGTNEAEDIIMCILRHPNEIGGADCDDAYFKDANTDETLTTSDYLVYSCAKNMVVEGDTHVYRNGIEIFSGFVWNYRNGTATFSASQQGNAITASYSYYTIQKSGMTLAPINFRVRETKNSYDAINEVCRRVSPNYIFRERRDGKFECDFYTQKAAGSEDIVIDVPDVVVRRFSDNPIYEQIATRVLSYGQASLEELPNLCLGKTVNDLWLWAWGEGSQAVKNLITDGDPATWAGGDYGRWDAGTYDVQVALIAAGDTGVPVFSIDLGDSYEVETVIVARGDGFSNEGSGGAIQMQSVWVSEDGSAWEKIVNAFELPPGQNIQFKAGTNWDEGKEFQHIKINLHSLGLFQNSEGQTVGRFDFGEVQCYEPEIIEGEAVLQDEDPTEPLYDSWGLLKRYGIMTHIARGGQPDPALNSEAKADLDARYILEELVRLMVQCEVAAPWLPAVPIFSTVKFICGALQRTQTVFIETRTVGADGDSFGGVTLP